MKTELTIEQSARLIELGVDPKLASQELIENICQAEYDEPRPKVFTLTDLLAILPKEIELDGVRASLQMYQHLAGYWIASYVIYNGNRIIHQRPLSADRELIITLYQLLIWAIENGYTKPNEQ